MKIPVYLRDMRDAKYIVQVAESCREDVDLMCGMYVVDAKSMLGVFSLPQFDEVKMRVSDCEKDVVIEKLKKLDLIREERNK